MTLYLSAPARPDFFRGGVRDELSVLDKSRSLYEFEVFEEGDTQKAYFRLLDNYDAKQLALQRYDTRIEYVCEPINEHSFDKTKSVVTTELGIAAKQTDGNWKVEKKAKIKYTENINEPEPELSNQKIEQEKPKPKPPKVSVIEATPKPAKSTVIVPKIETIESSPGVDTKTGFPVFDSVSPPPQILVQTTLPSPPPPPPPSSQSSTKKSPVGTIVVVLAFCAFAAYFLSRPSVETLFSKGKESFGAKNFAEAATYFSKAIKRKPDNVELRDWRGRTYYEQQNYESAVADFKEAVRLSPNVAEYHHWLGEAHYGTKNYESAVTAYTKAIGLEPNKANYYFSRAGARSAQKAYQSAVDDFTQAIRLDPSDARFYNSRGGDYRNLGDYDKAYIDHSVAIRLNPSEAKYHNNRGVAQVLRKKYVEAIPDYSEAIRLAPDNARYYNNRGDAYFLPKDWVKDIALANADYCTAVQYDSENITYRTNCEKTTKILKPLDSRDGQIYTAVPIGGKMWMAQNMNYRPSTGNTWCYGDNSSNCDKYGRLYDWNTAKAVCPGGWHLPSRKEWKDLVVAAGVSAVAGKKLKSVAPVWNGTDAHKFSARPGGYRSDDGSFSAVGKDGSWWTATENDNYKAYLQYMSFEYESVFEMEYDKSNGFSVRCVMDAR